MSSSTRDGAQRSVAAGVPLVPRSGQFCIDPSACTLPLWRWALAHGVAEERTVPSEERHISGRPVPCFEEVVMLHSHFHPKVN